MIPDFAFDYDHADFRLFFEVMGFWTPEYVAKKLGQLADVEDVDLLVAVDESLGVGGERDRRAGPPRGELLGDRPRESDRRRAPRVRGRVRRRCGRLPESRSPDADAIGLDELADEHGVSVEAIEDKSFPDHELVGRTLVRPAVLEAAGEKLEAGMAFSEVESILDDYAIDDASAALSRLGFRVEWEGLGGGTVREKASSRRQSRRWRVLNHGGGDPTLW